MQQVYVSLATAKQVQRFVKTLTPLEGDFELISGKYVLDARSLMGVFAMDLSQPILLKVYNASIDNMAAVAPFLSDKEVQVDG